MTRMDVWNGHRVAWMPGPPSTAESACGQLAAPRVRPTPVPGFPGPLTASGRPLVCGLPRLAPSIPGAPPTPQPPGRPPPRQGARSGRPARESRAEPRPGQRTAGGSQGRPQSEGAELHASLRRAQALPRPRKTRTRGLLWVCENRTSAPGTWRKGVSTSGFFLQGQRDLRGRRRPGCDPGVMRGAVWGAAARLPTPRPGPRLPCGSLGAASRLGKPGVRRASPERHSCAWRLRGHVHSAGRLPETGGTGRASVCRTCGGKAVPAPGTRGWASGFWGGRRVSAGTLTRELLGTQGAFLPGLDREIALTGPPGRARRVFLI